MKLTHCENFGEKAGIFDSIVRFEFQDDVAIESEGLQILETAKFVANFKLFEVFAR